MSQMHNQDKITSTNVNLLRDSKNANISIKGSCGPRCFELRQWKMGIRIVMCQVPCLILWRKLWKDYCKRCHAFPECVGPQILSLESVDYLGTSEYFGENFDGEAINWLGVHWLYAYESCDEHLIYFWWWLKLYAMFIFFGLWQWCHFSRTDFHVFIHV